MSTSAVACWPVSLVAIRWGGGAHHGKTHVFWQSLWSMAPFVGGWDNISHQCVVDDFGNLVAVPE